jgi:hypothetical protein
MEAEATRATGGRPAGEMLGSARATPTAVSPAGLPRVPRPTKPKKRQQNPSHGYTGWVQLVCDLGITCNQWIEHTN